MEVPPPDADLLDERRTFGILVGRESRNDRVLLFRLSGLLISSVGDIKLSNECSTGLPSGMVCGDTVSLLKILSALSVMALLPGESDSSSYVGDVVDANIGKIGYMFLEWAPKVSVGILSDGSANGLP